MKDARMRNLVRNLTLAGAMCATPVVCSAAFTNINFDTDTAGSPPGGGWLSIAQGSPGSTVQVNSALAETAPNSLELRTQTNFALGSDLARLLGMNTFAGNQISYFSNTLWRFSLRLTDNANQQFRFQFVNSGGSAVNQMLFRNGGIFAQYTTGFTETNLGSFVPNVWYSVNVETRVADLTYGIAVYSNGVLVGQARNLAYTLVDAPDGIMFISDGQTTLGTGGQQSVYIDNIFVGSQVPEPTTVSLLLLGAVAAVVLRRQRV